MRSDSDDLPSVSRGADPRGPIHVDAHVPTFVDLGLADVDPHARRRRPLCKRRLGVPGGGGRVAGRGEGEEVGVALTAELDTAVTLRCCPQQATVLGQHVGEARPVVLEEAGRALDVREQHRNGALRKRLHHRRPLESRIVAQDRLVELAKLGARLETQLADKGVAGRSIRLERIRLATGVVQGQHAVSMEALAQRVVSEQRLELGERPTVVAVPQVALDCGLESPHPKLVEAPDLGRGERLVGYVGERRPPPQPQCRPGIGLWVAESVLEALGVDGSRRKLQFVSTAAGDDRAVAEQLAELRHVNLDHLGRARRRVLAPQALGQPVHAQRAIGAQREHRKDRPLLGRSERYGGRVDDRLDGAQHSDLNRRHGTASCASLSR